MKSRRHSLPDRRVEAVLSGKPVAGAESLQSFVAEVLALASTVPPPSSELAAMFESGMTDATPVTTALPTVRRRISWGRAALAGAAGSLTLLSAGTAANALPAPAQTAVADVVEALTPLDLPRPEDRDGQRGVESDPQDDTDPDNPAESDEQRPDGEQGDGVGTDDGGGSNQPAEPAEAEETGESEDPDGNGDSNEPREPGEVEETGETEDPGGGSGSEADTDEPTEDGDDDGLSDDHTDVEGGD